MFTEIKSIITNYTNQYDALKDALIAGKKAIYQGGLYSDSHKDLQFAELKAKYETDRQVLLQDSKAQMEVAFEKLFAVLEDAVTAELGQETIADLQLLLNTKVSRFEIDAYAKKFAGNFKALRFLNKIAENNGIEFSYVSDADVISDLNETKAIITKLLNEYSGGLIGDYATRYVQLSASDSLSNDNRFSLLEAEINLFLKPVCQ